MLFCSSFCRNLSDVVLFCYVEVRFDVPHTCTHFLFYPRVVCAFGVFSVDL